MKQVEELRAQADAQEPTAADSALKKHPIAKRGPQAVEAAIVELESDITSLQKQKKDLETEVATLQKDLADYKAKNL